MNNRTITFLALLLMNAAACDGDAIPGGVGGQGGGFAGSGGGSAGQGGTGGGAGSGGSGGLGGTGGTGGSPFSCAPAAAKPNPVTIRFENNGGSSVFLNHTGDCGFIPGFTLARCGDEALAIVGTCSQCLCDRCATLCPAPCPGCAGPDGPMEVKAGESKAFAWPGTAFVSHAVKCGTLSMCVTTENAPLGTYQLAVPVRDSKEGAPRVVKSSFSLPFTGSAEHVVKLVP